MFVLELLAAATPVWVTVLLAVVTGIFGLLSGAAAAAGITTSHETRERFRDRMIKTADAFLFQLQKVEDALKHVVDLRKARPFLDDPDRDPDVRAAFAEFETQLAKLDRLMPSLWIVFRTKDPAWTAVELKTDFLRTRNILHKKAPFSEVEHELSLLHPRALPRHSTTGLVRFLNRPPKPDPERRLLQVFNREIRRRWRL